jgi:hypothetical protein
VIDHDCGEFRIFLYQGGGRALLASMSLAEAVEFFSDCKGTIERDAGFWLRKQRGQLLRERFSQSKSTKSNP